MSRTKTIRGKKNTIRGPYADYTRECKNQHILIVLHCFCNTLARSDAQNAWNMIGICMEYVWNMREISWKVEPSSPPTSGPEWAQALRWRSQDQGTIRELYAKAPSGTQLKPQQKAPGCRALIKRDRAMIELIKNSYAQNLYVSCLSTPLAQNLNFFIPFSLTTYTFSHPSR